MGRGERHSSASIAGHLKSGNAAGTEYKIVFKNKESIVALHLAGDGPIASIIGIDKTAGRVVEVFLNSVGPSSLSGRFYECR